MEDKKDNKELNLDTLSDAADKIKDILNSGKDTLSNVDDLDGDIFNIDSLLGDVEEVVKETGDLKDADLETLENAAEKIKDNIKDTLNTAKDSIEEIDETEDNAEMKEALENVEEMAEEVFNTKEAIDNGEDVDPEKILETIDFKEKYIESLATMENLRKRLETEKTDIHKYRASSFIQSILPTLDMFELATNAENISDEIKNWLVGFKMILNNFKDVLDKEGVTEIKVMPNDEFDSAKHHAIEKIKSDDVEPGHIVEVKQKGYILHDRLLRPAAVVVAENVTEQVEEHKEETKLGEKENE